MYSFIMSIGDWSGDGHEKSEDFIVSSTVPVEKVREAHYRIPEATGIDFEAICSNYGDNCIDKQNMKALKELGFQFKDPTGLGDQVMDPEEMARLWIFLLQKADSSLYLQLKRKEELPTLHFYGNDGKGRHIAQIGYGVFN